MTMTTKNSVPVWLGAAALAVALSACGAGETSGSAVTGVALSDAPISGTVTITDSSAAVQTRTVSTRADGSFSVDVADLTPPYMLRVADGGTTRLYAVTGGNDNLDVNPITDMAFSAASAGSDEETVFQTSSREEKRTATTRASALLARLKTVLAPLFQRYGITDPAVDKAAVRLLLADVRITREDGVVTVTNRATGAVIFEGPLADLASGTFDPTAMPDGPGTGGGTGGGTDGAALYAASCQSCHGALATSQVRGESASSITSAIRANEGGMGALSGLTSAQISAIAAALSGSTGGGTGGTCTSFTYSAWGTCTNGSQSRTVLTSSPSGCTGGAPVTTQSCSSGTLDGMALYNQYCAGCHGTSKLGSSASAISGAIASNRGGMGSLSSLTSAQIAAIAAAGGTTGPATCTGFTYSTWGACTNGSQTRTVVSSTPSGCTGGNPVTTQACTVTPATCTGFTYSAWGTCTNGSQTRTVTASSPSGCTGGSPVTTQSCTVTPATCTSFTYSAWGTCTNGSQSRTVTASSPSGCAGGAPVLTQACTAAIDGAALYTQYCSGCHGNGKKGSSASAISAAIAANRGGMGTTALKALTAAQIAAISAAP